MSTTAHDELLERVTTALTEVALAEGLLEATLRDIGIGGARAEKVTVTATVTDAFSRLRRAHSELQRLRDLLVPGAKPNPR